MALPNSKDARGLVRKYLAHVRCEGLAVLREAFSVNGRGTFSFMQSIPTVYPQGWKYIVRPTILEYSVNAANLILEIERPEGDTREILSERMPMATTPDIEV